MQVNDYNRESRKFGDNENLDGQQFYVLSLSTQVSEESLILFQQSIRARLEKFAFDISESLDICPKTNAPFPVNTTQLLSAKLQTLLEEVNFACNEAKLCERLAVGN